MSDKEDVDLSGSPLKFPEVGPQGAQSGCEGDTSCVFICVTDECITGCFQECATGCNNYVFACRVWIGSGG